MLIQEGKEKEYADWKAKNSDPYSAGVFSFAERWAEMMETQIEEEHDRQVELVIEANAKRLSHEADTEGITGFMYGMAVSVLSLCWVHGEALRRWHNLDSQVGNEGELANITGGVLNPAVVNIG